MASWDFSGDEVAFLLAAAVVAVAEAVWWYGPILAERKLGGKAGMNLLAVVPMGCLLGIGVVAGRWGDPVAVAGHRDYVFLFVLGGAVWVFGMGAWMSIMGVSARRDGIERGNSAAVLLVSCGMVAGAVVYAGANIGAGPTIWTTIVPAGVGTGVLMAGWMVVSILSDVSDGVAIERDGKVAVRNGGLLVGMGLVIARGAAGDWWDWGQTFGDLVKVSWVVGVMGLIGVGLNRKRVAKGVAWQGLGFVVVGVLYWVWVGPVEVGKHVVTYEQYMGMQ